MTLASSLMFRGCDKASHVSQSAFVPISNGRAMLMVRIGLM